MARADPASFVTDLAVQASSSSPSRHRLPASKYLSFKMLSPLERSDKRRAKK